MGQGEPGRGQEQLKEREPTHSTSILGFGLCQDIGEPDCLAVTTGWDQLRIRGWGLAHYKEIPQLELLSRGGGVEAKLL